MASRRLAEFVVFRPDAGRGKQYLFEHNGQLRFGPKAVATRYRGRIAAERARLLAPLTIRSKVVRA